MSQSLALALKLDMFDVMLEDDIENARNWKFIADHYASTASVTTASVTAAPITATPTRSMTTRSMSRQAKQAK